MEIETVRWQGADHRILRTAHGGDNGYITDGGDQVIIKYGDGSERVVLAAGDDLELGDTGGDGGFVSGDGDGAPAADAPVNVDRPYVEQTGNTMTCTMGNWDGMPTSYAYQWQKDGVVIDGATMSSYTVLPADVGGSIACVITATNAAGSTESTSVAVVAT